MPNSLSGTFTGVGRSALFSLPSGAPPWDLDITITGTFVGSIQLERSMDGGETWAPIFILGTQYYVWTAPAAESYQMNSIAPVYSFNCTAYASGAINFWITE